MDKTLSSGAFFSLSVIWLYPASPVNTEMLSITVDVHFISSRLVLVSLYVTWAGTGIFKALEIVCKDDANECKTNPDHCPRKLQRLVERTGDRKRAIELAFKKITPGELEMVFEHCFRIFPKSLHPTLRQDLIL